MNCIALTFKRPFIWFLRFRHRCGYGVHSPFAFNLITGVIYEEYPYYSYEELIEKQKELALQENKHWSAESNKVKQLLFRLVNYAQPSVIIDAGTVAASSLYLKAAKPSADYTAAPELSELFLEKGAFVDFLYLHDYRHPDFVEGVFDVCASRVNIKSMLVVEGIHYSKKMRKLWKRMCQDERTGISFDLYDLGILFFDKTKIKQAYIVNF